ncbi:MAG: NAD(P)/FAD-dependent oxidoreductase [Acidobacteria bacterium]|uniref:NAD(P)/FAD-dependent oxidoreductase n=1 Tax=Candidatus Polarisedimenticola svalbardensis TaxID=2886004 RepID=A0A8J6Y3C9_9BACT|nr:NAD(P)/FAD-dependent oxidoreductase [Candidatus Polarisedimenticola svalbardensis]
MTRPDLLVVGGGPVGLAVAIRARQKELSVRLIDSASPPMDKACGEGLMPDGVGLLEQLGVQAGGLEHKPFGGIRYLSEEVTVEGLFPGPPGLGVRRTELHRALVDRAVESGVDLHWNSPARGFTPAGVLGESGELQAGWIVAADGLNSVMRRAAGLEGREARRKRFGTHKHFEIEPWADRVEVYWAEGCEAYVTPVGPNSIGVAILWSGDKRPWPELLRLFPELRDRLRQAGSGSAERGAGPMEQRALAVYRGNLALAGDAAGYLDAITGEGLAVGFRQAFAVVDAIVQGDLAGYAREYRRIVRVPNAMTRLLMKIGEKPELRNKFLWTLAENPGLFDRLLAVMTRSIPARALGIGNAVRLLRTLF